MPSRIADVRVCLYLAIPTSVQAIPCDDGFSRKLKRRVQTASDTITWFTTRNPTIHFDAWNDRQNTNKGDMAIREAIRQLIRRALPEHTISFTELGWSELNRTTVGEIDRNHDLFVLAGSGYFHLDRDGELPERVLRDLELLPHIGCPKIAFGIGINRYIFDTEHDAPLDQLAGPRARNLMRQIGLQLDILSVRSNRTAVFLEGLLGKPVYRTGDPALFLKRQSANSPDRTLDDARLQIGLNFALHGPNSAKRLASLWPVYIEFLRCFQERHPVDWHYVQHARAERAIPLMLRSHGIAVTRHDPPAERLPDLYRDFDFHICQMLHSSILSLGAGTPTLNLAYDIKNMSVFDILGIPQFCIPPAACTSGTLLNAMQDLVRSRTSVMADIAANLNHLNANLERFLKEVRQVATARRKAGAA